MTSDRSTVLYVALGGAVAFILLLLVIFAFGRTEWGVQRVSRYAIERLQAGIAGELRVGRVTTPGTLLGGVTLHDFSLTDPDGRPFISADSARLSYDWRTLIGGDVVFRRVELYGPSIVLERLREHDDWNFARALRDPDEADDPAPGAARLVLLESLTITDGRVEVRTPFEPEPGEIASPSDTARILLEPGPGGLMRVIRLEALDADIPRFVVDTPDEEGMLLEFDALSTRAFVWREPIEVEHLRGALTLRDSVVTFEAPELILPASRASAIGRVVFGDDRISIDVRVDGERVALGDLKWLHPELPEEGGGRLVFRLQTQEPGGTLWFAEDLHITTPGTEIAGSFGIVVGDTSYFTRVQLRASPLDVQLLERLLPGDLPVDGLLVGTIEVEGPLSSLRSSGDLRLATERTLRARRLAPCGGWTGGSERGYLPALAT